MNNSRHLFLGLLLAAARVHAQDAALAVSSDAPKALKPPLETDILSVGGYRFTLSMHLVAPFEQLLRERTTEVQLLAVENVPVYFKGNTYRYQLPAARDLPALPRPSTAAARLAVLESEYGFFFFSPAQPELMRAFELIAGRPESYRRLMQPELSLREAELRSAPSPEGTLHTLVVESPRPIAGQWRKSLALVYRLWVRGQPVDALFLYKTKGGLSRLASALEELRQDGSSIIVSRGSLAARDTSLGLEGRSRLEALERLGLKVSGVGLGEFRYWDDLEAYVRDRSTGVSFISANLVLSSAPTVTVLPPAVILESGGLKVGFLGLTRLSYKKYMTAGKLRPMTLADPIQAALAQVRGLRERADVVVALSNLEPDDNARLRHNVRGIDLVLGDEEPTLPESQPRATEVFDSERRPYDACLLLAAEFTTAVNRLRLSVGPPNEAGARSMRVRQSHVLLDESIADQEGFPEFMPESYGVSADTQPALIPAARRIYPEGSPNARGGFPTIAARDFWNLAASLIAERTGAEAALLPLLGISVRTTGDFSEGMVRDWFPWEDALVVFELPGSSLQQLLSEISLQVYREQRGLPNPAAQLGLAAGGVGPGNTVHGVPIDPALTYRVAGTELLLGNTEAYPALAQARVVERIGELREEVIAALRRGPQQAWPPERYRSLMSGAAVTETPLWKVNFRDISLNASNTKVVRDDAFAGVPNSRVQGFDQQLVGYTAKIDLDYLFREYKWSNNFLVEYSRARLQPPGQAEVVNTPSNRLSFLTSGTRRVGSFPIQWLAQAYGPSLGFQFEGQVEKTPGLRRKQIYYLYPGVEFFNGTIIRSVELSANLKRDLSREPPNNQYGLRARVVGSAPIRNGFMTLQGETWANYFVLTRTDTSQDLRLEGDFNLKLQIPLYKHLTLAPFIDFYYFQLKTRALTGYSAISGISLGFSRLWKPQYERF